MNWILKNKNKKAKTLAIVLFLVFGFLFFAANDAKAAAGMCETTYDTEKSCECFSGDTSLKLFEAGTDISDYAAGQTGFCVQESCMSYCIFKFPKNSATPTTSVKFDGGWFGTKSSIANSSSAVQPAPKVGDFLTNLFVIAIRYVLTQIQSLVGWLFAMAATLFAWVIDPKNVSGDNGMLNKQAVKDVWIMVRDTLNMTFILVLLFAAFCTIFQIDKWNLKKVWLNILINALLVNFSYPIARFFIDVSNVAFYYFVNHLFSATGTTTVSGSTIFSSFGSASNIGNMLTPNGFAADPIAYQIATIIVIFIMGMTLMIIAALFIVRLVALTMLVMFSPVGFVGYIFPATHGFADKWWKQLFAYSFFAPIMIFIMAISLHIMEAMKNENFQSMVAGANANAPADQANWIATAAFYTIPIIILWMGMGIAKSMGIAGADKVVDSVKKGGKWLATSPWGAAKFASHVTGVSGGAKLGWDNFKKKGPLFGTDKIEQRAALIGRGLGDKHAVDDVQAKRVKEATDHHDMANMTDPDLQNLNTTGNEFERAAAVLELANRGKADAKNVDAVKKQFGDHSRVFNQVRNKVKTYDPTAAFATQLDPVTGKVLAFDNQRMTEHLNSNQFAADKVNSDALGVAGFVGLAMETGNMTPDDLAKLAKKGKPYADNIKASLTTVINTSTTKDANGNVMLDRAGNPLPGHQNMSNEIDRNIQMAFFASTGKINSSLETDPQKAEIVKRWDKDNAKKLTVGEIGLHADVIAKNVNSGKVKEIVTALADNKSKKAFVEAIMNAAPPLSDETVVLQAQIRRDHYLRAFI